MTRLRTIALVLSVALVGAGCTDEADETTPPSSTAAEPTTSTTTTTVLLEGEGDDAAGADTPAPEGAGGPTFTPTGCWIEVDLDAECGTVAVPVDHDVPDGDRLNVAVVVLRSSASEPAPDPVVYLDGGPGGNAIDTVPFRLADFYEPLLERGDVVVVDQRGVGNSSPALDCPELDAAADAVVADADRTDADEDEAVLTGLEACGERLRDEGVDIGAFDTVANARDLDVVRQALEIEQWNLVGISYGTRLGLEILRLHPEGVRAAVLDSVLPPEAEIVGGSAEGFAASFERVAVACAADPECAAAGELGDRLEAAVATLDDEPVPLEVLDPLNGTTLDVVADGDVLLGVVAGALYGPVLFLDVPDLLADLEAGSTEALATYLGIDLANREFASAGMAQAVLCSDEVNPTDPSVLDEVDVPSVWQRAVPGAATGPLAFEACERFGAVDVTVGASEPVTSDVPTLVLAGTYDPITPPSYATDAAEGLALATIVEHPHLSHATLADACMLDVAIAFLDDPATAPDASCVDEAVPLDFTPEGSGDLALERFSSVIDLPGAAVAVEADLPSAWSGQGPLDTDRARLRGVLDLASVGLVGGEPALLDFAVDFLVSSQGLVLVEEEPVVVDGIEWTRRSATSAFGVFDLFQSPAGTDGLAGLYVLGSGADERELLVEQVALPGLATFEVSPG